MPETANPAKSPIYVRGDERSLARCARRRFQAYSHLPVRCQRTSPYYRPPRAYLRLSGLTASTDTRPISTVKSCPASTRCPSVLRMIGTPSCKRSLSMFDLSGNELENGELRSESGSYAEENGEGVTEKIVASESPDNAPWMGAFESYESEERSLELFPNPRTAAGILCHVLVVNAWRQRRAETVDLRETIDRLHQRIEHSRLQIVVLRRLLDTENSRVGRLNGEVHRAKLQVDDTLRARDSLAMERARLEEEVKRLSELSDERLVTSENLQNELLTARNQMRSLDEQISRDREKLLKLREDKRILLDKVSAVEAVAEKAESVAEDLQRKLTGQIAETQRCSKELRANEEERTKLEKRLRSAEESGRSLNLRVSFLESQLAEREAALRRIQSTYNSHLTELNELRERFLRQSQEGGWSSRMLQIAGTVVRAPRAILRTLLSGTGSSLTS